jgi:nucleoside-diphosphate-sugar epimerase
VSSPAGWSEREGVLTLVTGAGGFVGRALVRRAMAAGTPLRLVDRAVDVDGAECVEADLTEIEDLAPLLDGVSCVVHLAALPGGAAEADPELSKRVNRDVTRNFLDAIAKASRPIRFVHASSIAVFGSPAPDPVTDDTEACPTSAYGHDKRMAEIEVQIAAEKGVYAVSLRLPGIVARPPAGAGFKSAFMSDVFWAVAAAEPYVVPVSPDATVWLMSAEMCAENLLHAVTCPLGARRVMTLPALRVRLDELVASIAAVTGGSAAGIRFEPDPVLEEQFGRLPALSTPLAESLGFKGDADLPALVRAALERESLAA